MKKIKAGILAAAVVFTPVVASTVTATSADAAGYTFWAICNKNGQVVGTHSYFVYVNLVNSHWNCYVPPPTANF